jgi:glycosyltransferase involved in cell wall biosynthesis
MKKIILFIMPDLNIGGAEKNLTFLVNYLNRKYFIIKLLLLKKEGFFLNYLKNDIEIFNLNYSRIRYSIYSIFKYINIINPDIVFCNYGELNAYLSPFIYFSNIKFIARETNIVSKHVTNKYIRFFYKFYNNFDKIIAQSNDMKKDLLYNYNITYDKIIKINNPAYLLNIKKLFKPACFYTYKKIVLCVGNLNYRKGYDNALHVFKYLLKKSYIHLFIIGEGPEKIKLLKLKFFLKLTNVTFLGRINNPWSYIKYSNILLLASRYEGFPNIALEAGLLGVPIMSNNCLGGIDEIIVNNINGVISDINNFKLFAKILDKTLKIKFCKKKIKYLIKNKFNKYTILNKYNNLFSLL